MAKIRLKLNTVQDIQKSLARVSNLVVNGELGAKEANAIIYACNVLLSSKRLEDADKGDSGKISEIIQAFIEA